MDELPLSVLPRVTMVAATKFGGFEGIVPIT